MAVKWADVSCSLLYDKKIGEYSYVCRGNQGRESRDFQSLLYYFTADSYLMRDMGHSLHPIDL